MTGERTKSVALLLPESMNPTGPEVKHFGEYDAQGRIHQSFDRVVERHWPAAARL